MPGLTSYVIPVKRETMISGTLWRTILARTQEALHSGAIQSINTDAEFIQQEGVTFLVRIISNLIRKEEEKQQSREQAVNPQESKNPFLPYESALWVGDISETHVCLLNKFNVVDHHILLVTRSFEEQESLLTLDDFVALWRCMTEFDGLAFYNSGPEAGASQQHKHLQMIPLPLASNGPKFPLEAMIGSATFQGRLGSILGLPFKHAIAKIDAQWMDSPSYGAQAMLACYRSMLNSLDVSKENPETLDGRVRPYNLLVTREWMLLVPRTRECFEGISINALGFVGAMLVKNKHQMDIVKAHGPMTVLQEVAFP